MSTTPTPKDLAQARLADQLSALADTLDPAVAAKLYEAAGQILVPEEADQVQPDKTDFAPDELRVIEFLHDVQF